MPDDTPSSPSRLTTLRTEPRLVVETQARKPEAIIKVELDERAYLFPRPKQLSHLQLSVLKPHKVEVAAIFTYNISGQPTELFELTADDVQDFAQQLVGSVYRAQSGMIVTKSISMGISVVANGYVWQFGEITSPHELYLSTGTIWRVCGAFGRACDLLSPGAKH